VILRAAAVALAVTLLGPPAHASTGHLPLHATDPSGDVNVFDGGGTKPTTGQRKSIDLTSFTAARRGDGVRFSFTIARIAAGRTFDQIVTVSFDRDSFQLIANPQSKHATSYGGDTVCLADVSTSRRTGTVRVDVPRACIPAGTGVLQASAYLQEKNGSGPGFSEDRLRVPGRVSLG
jgi:hypothetical protein